MLRRCDQSQIRKSRSRINHAEYVAKTFRLGMTTSGRAIGEPPQVRSDAIYHFLRLIAGQSQGSRIRQRLRRQCDSPGNQQ